MQSDNSNDCLTVLCFRVTQLTQENAQLKDSVQKATSEVRRVIDGAKKHNDKTCELVRNIKSTLTHPDDAEGIKRCDALLEHLA